MLYIREKDGKLNALIEWFFEYPLRRVSRDVYRFPNWGLYDGEEIVFQRGSDGRATVAVAGTVPFKRRSLAGDDDRVNFRITPVKPVADAPHRSARGQSSRGDGRLPAHRSGRAAESRLQHHLRHSLRHQRTTSWARRSTPRPTPTCSGRRPRRSSGLPRRLRQLGYGLLVHDSYRPWYVTKMFWDGTPVDKHLFVADPADGSRHNRGCAVDITLYDLKTGKPIRMTGGYDEMSDRSYPLYPGGTSLQRWHRDLLRHAMEAEGFTVYEAEWWHFDYQGLAAVPDPEPHLRAAWFGRPSRITPKPTGERMTRFLVGLFLAALTPRLG